jgi:mannose/fructose/N-acetylgalactosamine-specific phosphotransferase system component IIC
VSLEQAALLTVLGAVVFLDQWPVFQSMLSRPLVVGALVGVVLGKPTDGALWGAVFEAVYLGLLPIGAARYPDAGLATLAGSAVVLSAPASVAPPVGWAVAVALATGTLGDHMGGFLRRWNGRTAVYVRERVAAGDLSAPGRAIAIALLRGAALGAVVSAVALTVGLGGLALVVSTPWSGPLPMRVVVLAAAAALTVNGTRLFVDGRSRLGAWGVGLVLVVAAFGLMG